LVEKDRFDWIDVSKGLGIILVVVGHTCFHYADFIRNFNIPIFFVISGFLFNDSKWMNKVQDFYISRFKRLIIPYLVSCMFFYSFWLLIGRHFGENAEKTIPILKPLLGIVYASGTDDWLVFNTPLWFLPCLFMAELIFINLLGMFNGRQGRLTIGILVVTLLGYFISKIFILPWGFDIALIAQFFLYLGYQLRRKNVFNTISGIHYRLLLTFSAILLITAYYFNGMVDMNERNYKNFILFCFGGISGSVLIFALSQIIVQFQAIKGFLVACGGETLIILAFHNISFKMMSAVAIFFLHLPLKLAQQELWLVYSIVGITIPMCLGVVGKNRRVIRKIYYST
jgi:acyltransferase